MKSSIYHLLAAACAVLLTASPAFARGEPEPSPSPTPTPVATPSPTPGDDEDGDDHGGNGGGEHSGLSLHGLYEGTTSAGAVVILYVEKNTHIQVNVLDVAGQTIGFAEGQLTNGAFAFTLSNGQMINGTSGGEKVITGTVGGASFQATRPSEFGDDKEAIGRFIGVANGPTGQSRVMFVIDSSKHIVMLQTSGTAPNITRTGGIGTVSQPVGPGAPYTFTLDKSIGSSSVISGSFTIVDGMFQGTFTTSAGTFTVNSFKSTLVNRMANISTRGLVGSGQGQLIGGFIITGGPKLVMIRAIGPSLTAFGVSPALENPAITLFAGQTQLAQNDDWKTNSNASDITASGLAPKNDLEAALLVRLEPGAYTTVVSASGSSATGIALVEVYEVHHD